MCFVELRKSFFALGIFMHCLELGGVSYCVLGHRNIRATTDQFQQMKWYSMMMAGIPRMLQ